MGATEERHALHYGLLGDGWAWGTPMHSRGGRDRRVLSLMTNAGKDMCEGGASPVPLSQYTNMSGTPRQSAEVPRKANPLTPPLQPLGTLSLFSG